ncbi:MAG: hypothetical protein V2A71_10475 [Candidatus Eisenbacteria bacterium]
MATFVIYGLVGVLVVVLARVLDAGKQRKLDQEKAERQLLRDLVDTLSEVCAERRLRKEEART